VEVEEEQEILNHPNQEHQSMQWTVKQAVLVAVVVLMGLHSLSQQETPVQQINHHKIQVYQILLNMDLLVV
jgi:hypothetical protein